VTAPTKEDVELDARRWRALGVCVLALCTTLLDVSIVTVALPSIGRGTGAGPALALVSVAFAIAAWLVAVRSARGLVAARLEPER
jgi:hypothetical protein